MRPRVSLLVRLSGRGDDEALERCLYGGHNTQDRAVIVGCVKPRAGGRPVQRSATHVVQLACIAADAGHSAGGCLEGEEGGQCDCEGARACDLSVSLSVVDCERGCASSATLPSSGDGESTAGSSGVVSTAPWSAGASASPSPWPASMAAHSVPAVEWYALYCGRIRLLMLSGRGSDSRRLWKDF
jgi:hypothetical protein